MEALCGEFHSMIGTYPVSAEISLNLLLTIAFISYCLNFQNTSGLTALWMTMLLLLIIFTFILLLLWMCNFSELSLDG